MILRGKRNAMNKWIKIETPISKRTGRRTAPMTTARFQIIPEGCLNRFGERKITGIMLSELKTVAQSGQPFIYKDRDGRETVRVETGPGETQWSREELEHIIATVEAEGGVLLNESPMGVADVTLVNQKAVTEMISRMAVAVTQPQVSFEEEEKPKRRGRPPKNAAEPTDADA